MRALGKAFPVRHADAAQQIQASAVCYSHCIDYIEFMLEQQLVVAVGKVRVCGGVRFVTDAVCGCLWHCCRDAPMF